MRIIHSGFRIVIAISFFVEASSTALDREPSGVRVERQRVGGMGFMDGLVSLYDWARKGLTRAFGGSGSKKSDDPSGGSDPPASSKLGLFDSSLFNQVVVIPDVHGDADFFIESLWIGFTKVESRETVGALDFKTFRDAILATAETIEFPSGLPAVQPDAKLSKMGQSVAIVQLGDIMDRGLDPFLSYKILASIEPVIGWKLIQLFGNHELMIYDPSCHEDERSSCGGETTYFNTNDNSMVNGHGQLIATDIANEAQNERIVSVGQLFGPGGSLWKYLNSHNLLMARIGGPYTSSKYTVNPKSPDTLFVHAGYLTRYLVNEIPGFDRLATSDLIGGINLAMRNQFSKHPEKTAGFAKDKTSPVNIRLIPNAEGSALEELCNELAETLVALQVSRIVVGHTPPKDGNDENPIRTFCHKRFIVTDVMMSRGFTEHHGGQPFGLVMNLESSSLDSIFGYFEKPHDISLERHYPVAADKSYKHEEHNILD